MLISETKFNFSETLHFPHSDLTDLRPDSLHALIPSQLLYLFCHPVSLAAAGRPPAAPAVAAGRPPAAPAVAAGRPPAAPAVAAGRPPAVPAVAAGRPPAALAVAAGRPSAAPAVAAEVAAAAAPSEHPVVVRAPLLAACVSPDARSC